MSPCIAPPSLFSTMDGPSRTHEDGKRRRGYRSIDKNENKCVEMTTGKESGEVVHECREPLTGHRAPLLSWTGEEPA